MRAHWLLPPSPFVDYPAYRAAVGGDAVARARELGVERVIDELLAARLRGRGGAGFPAGQKWRSLHQPFENRYVVCNLAEGEPGTYKDRFLVAANPYAVLEGMLVAATVLGAAETLYVATKAGFRPTLERLAGAIDELEAAGLTGRFHFELVEGPDEYLFGEEKALLSVIEGKGPFPREAHYPPYERGLFDSAVRPHPALVHNAETWARVPGIVRHGAASFRQIGTEDTPGTLLVTLSGDLGREGVFEVEAGTPLARLLEDHGAGPRPGRRFVAALSGVASPALPAARFDTPLEFGAMAAAGSGLGSAGFVLIDDATPIPRVAAAVARFLYVEACGQCSACKAGLGRASDALERLFVSGSFSADELLEVVEGAQHAPQGNRCYLPVQGSRLIPSLLRDYPEQFRGAASGEPWELPKLVRLDARSGRFARDHLQQYKQPDWSYQLPEGGAGTDARDEGRAASAAGRPGCAGPWAWGAGRPRPGSGDGSAPSDP